MDLLILIPGLFVALVGAGLLVKAIQDHAWLMESLKSLNNDRYTFVKHEHMSHFEHRLQNLEKATGLDKQQTASSVARPI